MAVRLSNLLRSCLVATSSGTATTPATTDASLRARSRREEAASAMRSMRNSGSRLASSLKAAFSSSTSTPKRI